MVVKGKGGNSRMGGKFGVSRCNLLHLGWKSDEVLLDGTGNYIQSLGIDLYGR